MPARTKVLNSFYSCAFLVIAFFISAASHAQEVTYTEHIAPIIEQKCVSCHQDGHLGPMPLTNYEEVKSYGSMIKYVTQSRLMPPWKAVNKNLSFINDRSLKPEEIAMIKEWIENDMARGEARYVKKENPLKSTNSTGLKDPDLVIHMEEAFEQYGVYYDQYKVFVIPYELTKEQMITEIEFKPGNAEIVWGASISIDTSNSSDQLDEWDPQYGYFSFGEIGVTPTEGKWYTWTPGKGITVYAPGSGKYLPQKGNLLLHIHYGPTGIPASDSSVVKMKFATQSDLEQIQTAPLLNLYNLTNDSFYIPEDQTVRFHSSFRVPGEMKIYGVYPYSHLLCNKWEVFAVSPEGDTSFHLLKVEDWDFHWKQMYEFDMPIVLQEGWMIHGIGTYDNTKNNLSNPNDPPRPMNWGNHMFKEMLLVYFDFSTSSKSKTMEDIHIKPGNTNSSNNKMVVQFENRKPSHLTCILRNFEGNLEKYLFTNKVFDRGTHNLVADLNGLPYGNYYLELQTTDLRSKLKRVFVYLNEKLFE